MLSAKKSSRATWKSCNLLTGKYQPYRESICGLMSSSWTAVVRGALMKGLASTSPAFATVTISGRSARKHYGINCGTQYLEIEHGNARKIWDACSGFYRTYMMEWFIEKVPPRNSHANPRYLDTGKQGHLVKEDDPVRLNYQRKKQVSRGPFTTISTSIYYSSDPQNSGAPKYVEDGKSSTSTHVIRRWLNPVDRKRDPARQSRSRPEPHPRQ